MGTVDETDLSRHHVLPVERYHLSRQNRLQLGNRQERQGTSQQTEAQVTETVKGNLLAQRSQPETRLENGIYNIFKNIIRIYDKEVCRIKRERQH